MRGSRHSSLIQKSRFLSRRRWSHYVTTLTGKTHGHQVFVCPRHLARWANRAAVNGEITAGSAAPLSATFYKYGDVFRWSAHSHMRQRAPRYVTPERLIRHPSHASGRLDSPGASMELPCRDPRPEIPQRSGSPRRSRRFLCYLTLSS